MSTKPLLIDVRAAAQALSISPRGLAYLLENGTLPSKRIGRRRLIRVADLEKFAAAPEVARVREVV